MSHVADNVAIRMARTLANAGFDVRMYLLRDEWTVIAAYGGRQCGFGFRVCVADRLSHPEAFADYHARRLVESFGDEGLGE